MTFVMLYLMGGLCRVAAICIPCFTQIRRRFKGHLCHVLQFLILSLMAHSLFGCAPSAAYMLSLVPHKLVVRLEEAKKCLGRAALYTRRECGNFSATAQTLRLRDGAGKTGSEVCPRALRV